MVFRAIIGFGLLTVFVPVTFASGGAGFSESNKLSKVDWHITVELSEQSADDLYDCGVAYRYLSSLSPDDGEYSPENLKLKANVYEKALYVKGDKIAVYELHMKSTSFIKMLEGLESRAITEDPHLAKEIMEAVFSKDTQCTYIYNASLEKLKADTAALVARKESKE